MLFQLSSCVLCLCFSLVLSLSLSGKGVSKPIMVLPIAKTYYSELEHGTHFDGIKVEN